MTAQWKLRRLASRSVKVLDRNKDRSPAIAAFAAPLGTAAGGFINAYSRASAYDATWRREMAEGRGEMAALKKDIDLWKPHVARERPGFDLGSIADRPTVPEDLVEDALALADQLETIVDAGGATVAWAAAGATSLRARATRAEKETDEAAAADAMHSNLLGEVRNAAAVFHAELGRFRETLRSALGSAHPDVVKLRINKAAASDADDDPASPAVADPVVPAPQPPTG